MALVSTLPSVLTGDRIHEQKRAACRDFLANCKDGTSVGCRNCHAQNCVLSLERKNMDQLPQLAVSDSSHKITKPGRRVKDLRHSGSGAQVIKTDVSNFRSLVQQLTGTAKNASVGVLATPFPSLPGQTLHPSHMEASMFGRPGIAVTTTSPIAVQSPLLPLPHMVSARLQQGGHPHFAEQARHVKRQQLSPHRQQRYRPDHQYHLHHQQQHQQYQKQQQQQQQQQQQCAEEHQSSVVQHTRSSATSLASSPSTSGAGTTTGIYQQQQQQQHGFEPMSCDRINASIQFPGTESGSSDNNGPTDVVNTVIDSTVHNLTDRQTVQMMGTTVEAQMTMAGDERAEMMRLSSHHLGIAADMGDGGDGAGGVKVKKPRGVEAQMLGEADQGKQTGIDSAAAVCGTECGSFELETPKFEVSTGSLSGDATGEPEPCGQMTAEGGLLTVEDMMTGSDEVMDVGEVEEREAGSCDIVARIPSVKSDRESDIKMDVRTTVIALPDGCSKGVTQVTEGRVEDSGAQTAVLHSRPEHDERLGAESMTPVSSEVGPSQQAGVGRSSLQHPSMEEEQGSRQEQMDRLQQALGGSSGILSASRLAAAGSEAGNQQQQKVQREKQEQPQQQEVQQQQQQVQQQVQQQEQLQGSGAPSPRLSRLRSLAPPPIRASLPPLPPRSHRRGAQGRSPLCFTPTPTPPHSTSSSNSRSPSPALSPSVHSLSIPMSPHPSTTPHSRPSLLSAPPPSPFHSLAPTMPVPPEGRGILGPSPLPSPRTPFMPVSSLPGTPVRFTPPGSPYFASPLFMSPASSPRGFAWPIVLPDSPASVAMRQAALAMAQPGSPRPPSL